MNKKQIALAELQQQKVRLKDREKRLKADLDAFMAAECRKLRLALGGLMLDHIAEPAVRRALHKLLPLLRPALQEKLSAQLHAVAASVSTAAASKGVSKAADSGQLTLPPQGSQEESQAQAVITPAA